MYEADAPLQTDPPTEASSQSEPGQRIREEARRAIEAVVMVADEPADPRLLAQLLEISAELCEELCEELAAEYAESVRGFEFVKVAGGWRFQSHADLAPYVERFVLSGQSSRLSSAALETLAIVSYKQPISRAQVAAIRGVNVDGVMRTLQQRGYIGELARDPGPGQAVLFGTTSMFLERLGLNSLDELPPLGDFVPGAEVIEALESGLSVDIDPVDDAPVDPAPRDKDADHSETVDSVDAAEPEQIIDLSESRPVIELDALALLADDPSDLLADPDLW